MGGRCRDYVSQALPELERSPGGERIVEPLGSKDLEVLCSHLSTAFEGAGPTAAAILRTVVQGEEAREVAQEEIAERAIDDEELAPKFAKVAALLRRSLFMQRYADDMAARPSRVRDLAKQWSGPTAFDHLKSPSALRWLAYSAYCKTWLRWSLKKMVYLIVVLHHRQASEAARIPS